MFEESPKDGISQDNSADEEVAEELRNQTLEYEKLFVRGDVETEIESGAPIYPSVYPGFNYSGGYEESLSIFLLEKIDGTLKANSPDGYAERHYTVGHQDGVLTVEVEDASYSIEEVDAEADLGKTYEVDLPNRSTWTYNDFRPHAREIIKSEMTDASAHEQFGLESDFYRVELDPSDEVLAQYIDSQYETVTGTTPLNLSAEDIRSSNVELQLYGNSTELTRADRLVVEVSTDEMTVTSEFNAQMLLQ